MARSQGAPGTEAQRRESPGQPAVVAAIGANVACFALWRLDRRGGSRWLSEFLRANALCSRDHLRGGRLHTLLTSSVSHAAPLHFAVNTFGLGVFGSVAAEKLSATEVAGILAVCGTSSSAAHVLFHPLSPVLGASGALMGLVAAASLLEPERRFRMILPVPGATLTMLQVADLAFVINAFGFFVLRRSMPTVAWAAHLGGTASGLGLACGARWCNDDRRFAEPWALHADRCGEDWQRTTDSIESGVDRVVGLIQRLRGE
eukprot:CAMPEP_0117540936 /NCGR_PEP_ID=MMETSP0784-20121206/43756_1 /TAXON_ID=39447 /ORGANISM="" /LENGTH=259 /DNA_ID=CAMNT_0005337607 /DNA_START=103 /DNA_END=882 /DNA_ORIENTATION=+